MKQKKVELVSAFYFIAYSDAQVYITKCKLRKELKMVTTAKKLRFHTIEILESVARGEEITITLRGKPYAKLVPLKKSQKKTEDELFGIWKNNEKVKDVNRYVRKIRKGRFNAAD